MARARADDVIQRLTKLFYQSQSQIGSLAEVNNEILWILKNRNASPQFNGQSVTNLWLILKNYNYGYKNPKFDNDDKESLKHAIPNDIWENLLTATAEQQNNITFDELKIIFSVFKHMNIWQNADEAFSRFRQGFLPVINYFFLKLNITQTLITLTNLGYQWNDLKNAMREDVYAEISSILENKNPKELLTLLWACVTLGIPGNIFGEKYETLIKNTIQTLIHEHVTNLKNIPSVNLAGDSKWSAEVTILRQIQQVHLYFQLPLEKNYKKQLDDALDDCIKKEVFMVNKNYRTFQNAVEDVIKKIKIEYNFNYQIEASPLHLKPVDICFPDKKIILELNGPHHYNLHGVIRPKDITNKTIFEKHGYQVDYLKQSDWKNAEDKYNFVLKKLQGLGVVTQPKIESPKKSAYSNSAFYPQSPYFKSTQEDKKITPKPPKKLP